MLVLVVAVAAWLVAWTGQSELKQQTTENITVRLDRAARTAAAVIGMKSADTFTITRDHAGQPMAYQVSQGESATVLQPSMRFDVLVEDIARVNQGFVNLFRFDTETAEFVRIATSMRAPDGSYQREVRFGPAHPAYASLMALERFVGEVPQLNRSRMAYLTPIVSEFSTIAGAIAVDVGWVDDLWFAATELEASNNRTTLTLIALSALLGGALLFVAMYPLRQIARYARAVASNDEHGPVPYLGRRGEIGALAAGIAKVVDMRARLEKLAFFDSVTGKPNRTRFEMLLQNALKNARAESHAVCLMLIGIDQFRSVNDTFGHRTGDAVLRQIAEAISGEISDGDIVARINADEFAVLVKGIDRQKDAKALAQRCISRLDKPFSLPQGDICVTASVGIVMLPRAEDNAADAMRDASLALHKAKADGRRQILVMTAGHRADAERTMELQRELRHALVDRQLLLHFQPQIAPDTHGLFGVEALVRWSHPEQGMVSPAEFIPVAEDSGLIVDLGRFVLDEACRTARQWLDCGFEFRHISINISPIQLWQPRFDRLVSKMLVKHGLPPHCLCLEVTESVFVNREVGRVMDVLTRLSQLGVTLSLDDFGTGYSSLGYLQEMPFRQLKIDRSFIRGAQDDPNRAKLLAGMVALARGLDLQVIAEGVETEEELDLVRALGCDAVQGFYFAKPVPALMIPIEVNRIRRSAVASVAGRKPDLKLAT